MLFVGFAIAFFAVTGLVRVPESSTLTSVLRQLSGTAGTWFLGVAIGMAWCRGAAARPTLVAGAVITLALAVGLLLTTIE